jgi:hypothetical protein
LRGKKPVEFDKKLAQGHLWEVDELECLSISNC